MTSYELSNLISHLVGYFNIDERAAHLIDNAVRALKEARDILDAEEDREEAERDAEMEERYGA